MLIKFNSRNYERKRLSWGSACVLILGCKDKAPVGALSK